MDENTKTCPNCQHEIASGTKFCPECGFKLMPEIESVVNPEPEITERKTKDNKREILGLGLVCLVIIILGLMMFSASNKSKASSALSTSPTKQDIQQTAVEKSKYSLGVTLNDFQERFNKEAASINSSFQIVNLQMSNNNTFNYRLANSVVLVGEINDSDKKLKWASLLMQTGTYQAGIDNVNALLSFLTAINPEMSHKDDGKILNDLGVLNSNINDDTLDNKIMRNNKLFHIKCIGNSSGSNFITLVISDPNDPDDHSL